MNPVLLRDLRGRPVGTPAVVPSGMLLLLSFAAFAADPREARCQAGEGTACHDLAVDAVKTDPGQALAWARHGCDAKDEPSCTIEGLLLAEGRGVTVDRKTASKLLEDGCKAKDVAACRGLANLLQDGLPPADDVKRAGGLWEDACLAQDWPSCAMLGGWWLDHGVEPDAHVEAMRDFGLACQGGFLYGCSRLAAMGWDPSQPSSDAGRQLEEYCGEGEPYACSLLHGKDGAGK